jgi:AraC-like DNA-binding protein
MIKLDWTIPATVFTLSGIVLIWVRSKLSSLTSKKKKENKDDHDERLLQTIYNKSIQLLEEEQIFLNKSLRVIDMADRFNHSEKIVSRAINKYSNGNFNTFINKYRVEHSKVLLLSGRLDYYTIEAIAEESGFANKVSFYSAFKSVTGMSPKEFRTNAQ